MKKSEKAARTYMKKQSYMSGETVEHFQVTRWGGRLSAPNETIKTTGLQNLKDSWNTFFGGQGGSR